MRRPRAVVGLAFLVIVSVACARGGGAAAPDVEGVTWVLDGPSIDGLGVAGVPADARIDLRFDAGQVGGRSACNSYGGSYSLDGTTLSFGPLGGTEMGCEPAALMEVEQAYLGALARVTELRRDGDRLRLTGDDVDLAYDAEQPPEPLPLTGTRWELSVLAYGGDTVASPIVDALPTVRFADDGTLGGSTGCNEYGGRYQVDGSAIAIGDLQTTLIGCDPAIAEQEDVFQRALVRAATFGIVGDALTLSDADGRFLVSFVGTDG